MLSTLRQELPPQTLAKLTWKARVQKSEMAQCTLLAVTRSQAVIREVEPRVKETARLKMKISIAQSKRKDYEDIALE